MPISIDLTGRRFGNLTVLESAGSKFDKHNRRKRTYWKCKCDCGRIVSVQTSSLTTGNTKGCKSCGNKSINRGSHQASKTPLYAVYKSMKARCYCTSNKTYPLYGGRGITVCPDWISEKGFENFRDWSLKNGYTENLQRGKCTLDRIDNNKGYSPDNCRWTNQTTQVRNSRRCPVYLYKDKALTLPEWAEETGIPYKNLASRRNHGWDIKRMLETPIIHKNKERKITIWV